jgi:hypothetical protein
METIIGFVAGYLVGISEGKDSLQRLRSSWRAIRSSPEVHQLARQAVSLAGASIQQVSGRTLGSTVEGVTDLIARKAGVGTREPSQAA